MRLVYSLVLLAFLVSSLRGQIVTPSITAPTEAGINIGPSNGGEEFPLSLRVTVQGTLVAINCSITFSHPTRLVQTNKTVDSHCTDPGDASFTDLICQGLEESNSTLFILFQGRAVIQEICSGDTYTLSMTCGTTDAPNPPSFDITLGSSTLTVDLTDDAVLGDTENQTNVPIVDFRTNPSYHVTAVVKNTGCSVAQNVKCGINIPSPLKTPVSDGIIEFVPGESTGTSTCRQLVSHFDCPSPTGPNPNGLTLQINDTVTYIWGLSLTGNGTLDTTISCTASRLGSGASTDNIRAFGIGFYVNASSSTQAPALESDNTDDLVINTIVPLSVFGGIMLFLLIVGIVTVGVYIFVKKVILSEENVGF